jgi:uroporphyrinogen decarboxylase
MSRKDDMLDALTGRAIPEKVPTWEVEFHLWDAFASVPVVFGEAFAALTAAEQDRALSLNAEGIAEVCEKFNFAGLTLPPGRWESSPGIAAFYWLPPEVHEAQLRRIKALVGDSLVIIAHTGGVMAMPRADKYIEFSYKLFDAPEEVLAEMDRRVRVGREDIRRWVDRGVDACLCPADLADNSGPFYNPEQMDQFVYPGMKQWAAAVKEAGSISILHTDGNILPILDGIINSGIDAVQAIDPTAGLDLATVKAHSAGRICLCGNMDCGMLQTGTEDQVYECAAETMRIGKEGGRFVFTTSNVIEHGAPLENVLAMFRACRDFA